MRLSSRSYPHPVVGNRDDVPGAAFQATLEMTTDKQQVYIDVTVNCSSATLNDLVSSEKAVYLMHVECSNTFFRYVYEFAHRQHRISIPTDNLNDVVEVNVFACANLNIHDYRVDSAHADYGDACFEIKKGDVLAAAAGQHFYIPSTFDAMKRIGSIMQVKESDRDGNHPMEVDFNSDKILIILSKKDFEGYKIIKINKVIAAPFTMTFVFPVLLDALYDLKNIEAEKLDPFDDARRWVRALAHRIEKLGLGKNVEPIRLAQDILELPVKRALDASLTIAENMRD